MIFFIYIRSACVYIYHKTVSWVSNQFTTQISWNQLSSN